MSKLNKEEMLLALAEIAVNVEAELNYTNNTIDNNFKLLALCSDLSSYEVNKLYGRTSEYISDVIENTYEQATDNDEIQIIFRITRIKDNEVGYIRFRGRYSSWDSSEYYECDAVYPRKIETTIYETKLEKNID
jgi:hypothetical protein